MTQNFFKQADFDKNSEELDFQYKIIFNANSPKIGCLYQKKNLSCQELEGSVFVGYLMDRMA